MPAQALDDDRILTTHTGSLPRPSELVRMMWDIVEGKAVDDEALDASVMDAVAQVVQRQDRIGIDIVSDGEMGKAGFSTYVDQRYSGFEGETHGTSLDFEDFPELGRKLFDTEAGAHVSNSYCVGPIELVDKEAVHRDIDRFKAALNDRAPSRAFLNAVTPGQMTFNHPTRHYASHEEYLKAAANAVREEYLAIVESGLTLQLDSPDLAMSHHFIVKDSTLPDFETHIVMAVEALNQALEGIPPDRVRLHMCWGNYPGPHHKDVPLRSIIEIVLGANVRALSFEAANPRHAHEWEVFEEVKLPDDKVLLPGMIDVTTNRIEHPRLIAQRIERFAALVGRDRVIAGTDCGLGTYAGWENVDPEVGWAKLESLVAGARIASERLW